MISSSAVLFEPLRNSLKLKYGANEIIYYRDSPLIELNTFQTAVENGSIQYVVQEISGFVLPELILTLADRGWINISDNRYKEWTKKRRAT